MTDVDWPDDTLELMAREAGPWPPFKAGVPLSNVRYPVTVPVLTDDVELYCAECDRWELVAEWEAGLIDMRRVCCPTCLAAPADGHEHGEYERRAPGLFTAVLPVPPRHYPTAFDPDLQARNALEACRLARLHARRAGLEPA